MSVADTPGPSRVALGWIEHGSRKDAVEYAKGYAVKHFDAPTICWYAVLPMLGGWLFEIQEGGPGRSHLTAVARALTEGVEKSWFRVGRRAYLVQMRDGRPFCVLLPENDSQALLTSEEGKLLPKGNMERVIKHGTAVLAIGATIFITGLLFFMGVGTFRILGQQYVPQDRTLDADLLPHRQWARVQNIPPNLYVETLKLDPNAKQWLAVVKPIQQHATPPSTTTPSGPNGDFTQPPVSGAPTSMATPVQQPANQVFSGAPTGMLHPAQALAPVTEPPVMLPQATAHPAMPVAAPKAQVAVPTVPMPSPISTP